MGGGGGGGGGGGLEAGPGVDESGFEGAVAVVAGEPVGDALGEGEVVEGVLEVCDGAVYF